MIGPAVGAGSVSGVGIVLLREFLTALTFPPPEIAAPIAHVVSDTEPEHIRTSQADYACRRDTLDQLAKLLEDHGNWGHLLAFALGYLVSPLLDIANLVRRWWRRVVLEDRGNRSGRPALL